MSGRPGRYVRQDLCAYLGELGCHYAGHQICTDGRLRNLHGCVLIMESGDCPVETYYYAIEVRLKVEITSYVL